MKLVEDDPVPTVNYQRCGCSITEHADGRKMYAPCIPCGLMQAGAELAKAGESWWRRKQHLRMAGAALAAVATTINNAAKQAEAVSKAVAGIAEEASDE
jgi:hypothetical protein